MTTVGTLRGWTGSIYAAGVRWWVVTTTTSWLIPDLSVKISFGWIGVIVRLVRAYHFFFPRSEVYFSPPFPIILMACILTHTQSIIIITAVARHLLQVLLFSFGRLGIGLRSRSEII